MTRSRAQTTTNLPMVFDHRGGAMRAAATSSHRGADRYSQELARWSPSMNSADRDFLPERNDLVARTRDMTINNGWAAGAIQRHVDQAIGGDFKLSARPDWRALGWNFTESADWAKQTEASFRSWANDPRHLIDAAERNNLSGLLGVAFRHHMVEGESLGIAHWLPNRGSKFATAIQIIDPDRLSNPNRKPDTDRLRGGVEINRFGAPQAFHIRNGHPSDVIFAGREQYRWTRVPKRVPGQNRLRVLHHFEAARAGQTRGKPLMASVLEKFKMLDQYERTELQAALTNAVFAAFIESPFDHDVTADALGVMGDSYQDQRSKYHEASNLTLDGMKLPFLFPGEKLNFQTASRPNAGFADFERAVLRNIAAGLGQSYEQVAQDWSQTNYSSARASLLESWKFLTARRLHFTTGFATPIYTLWLEEAIDNGEIELPSGVPGFWDAPAAWSKCRWRGPARGWVDPTKEAQAALLRIGAGLSTLQQEADEQGQDFEDILEQQRYEQDRRRELGLKEPDFAAMGRTSPSRQSGSDTKTTPADQPAPGE